MIYQYDNENRLIEVEIPPDLPEGGTYAYAYDYRTRRVQRTEPGPGATHIVFDGGVSILEYGAAGATSPNVEYVRGHDYGGGVGGLEYSVRGGTAAFNFYDSRGDVTTQTDATGGVTYQAAYEAFGNQTATSGSTLDRQKANTKEQDPTGLLNEGFRYRDPSTGTFLTRDPLGFKAGPNMYCYVQQNPWTHFDPEGLDVNESSKHPSPPPPPPPTSTKNNAPPPKQTTTPNQPTAKSAAGGSAASKTPGATPEGNAGSAIGAALGGVAGAAAEGAAAAGAAAGGAVVASAKATQDAAKSAPVSAQAPQNTQLPYQMGHWVTIGNSSDPTQNKYVWVANPQYVPKGLTGQQGNQLISGYAQMAGGLKMMQFGVRFLPAWPEGTVGGAIAIAGGAWEVHEGATNITHAATGNPADVEGSRYPQAGGNFVWP